MKVKIGNTITDVKNEPIMLIFNDDKEREAHAINLLKAKDGTSKYLTYNENSLTQEAVDEFIKIG